MPELSRGEQMYNEAAIRHNDLLRRLQALKRENEVLRAEAIEWKQKFFRTQDALSRVESDSKKGDDNGRSGE